MIRVLAIIPFVFLLGGVFFFNQITPYVLGMPFLLFWCVLWTVLTSVIMAIIYKIDPKNKESEVK